VAQGPRLDRGACTGIDYYAETFPAMAATALRTLEAVVIEAGA
jgi:hypothetical protein